MSSHTASLAGDYTVFSAVLSQFGVLEAENESHLLASCGALSCYQRPVNGNVGIITGSGGHGALAVDLCSKLKLSVPTLSEGFQTAIRERLSPSVKAIAALSNPLDLTGSAVDDDFVEAVNQVGGNPDIDCLILLLLPYLPGLTSDLGARLSLVYERQGKPLIAYVPQEDKYRMLIEGFEYNGIPVASSVEGAVQMASALRKTAYTPRPESVGEISSREVRDKKIRDELREIVRASREQGWITEPDSRRLLAMEGLNVPRHRLTRDVSEALEFAGQIGFPVVAKVVSPQIVHKSDQGGVIAGIDSDQGLKEAFSRLSRLQGLSGVLIEEMVHGLELILGAKMDHQFGPVVLLGIGGTGIEIYKDTAIRMAPVDEEEVESMLHALKGYSLLTCYRGGEPVNIMSLKESVMKFSRFIMKLERDIKSVDINPLICNQRQCVVADARIILRLR